MKIFLVGGAVRDFLLGKIKGYFKTPADIEAYWSKVEKDWVVVGSTPEEMLSLGYRQVGKSFPVFLHPETKDEYALARTERKIGKGYTGFECYAEPDVTLEDDLKRRDLTINAIAMRVLNHDFSQYEIIDPYHGEQHLKDHVFKHLSQAFSEDPVRILRIARLATRFGDFQVDPSTLELMKTMVEDGEVDALVPERVWQEWVRSLKENAPWRFFEILQSSNAMEKLFPEISHLAFKKKILSTALENATDSMRLSIQLYDLQETELARLIKRYRIPNDFRDLALIVQKYFPIYYQLAWTSQDILELLERTDAFRRRKRFEEFLTTCDYLAEDLQKDKSTRLLKILEKLSAIDNSKIIAQGFKGAEFADQLRKIRLEIIEDVHKN